MKIDDTPYTCKYRHVNIDMLVKPIDAEVKILGGVTKYEN